MKRFTRFFKYPYGVNQIYTPIVLENISLQSFAQVIKPQIRRPVGLLLDKHKVIGNKRFADKIQDYTYLRKYKIYPMYALNKSVKQYFKLLNPYFDALYKYALNNNKWDLMPYNNDYGFHTTLLLVLDINSPINEYKETNVYAILKRFFYKVRKDEIEELPNDIIVALIDGKKTMYIPIVVNKDYNKFNIAINVVKRIIDKIHNRNPSEVPNEDKLEAIASNILGEVANPENDKALQGMLFAVSSDTGINNTNDAAKIVVNKLTPVPIEDNLVAKETVKEIARKGIILKPDKVEVDKINPVTKVVKEEDILDNQVPNQVITYLHHEFNRSVDTLVNLINSYSSAFNLQVVNYSVYYPDKPENEIVPSDVFYVKLKFVDTDLHKTYEITVKLPVVQEDGSLLINGKKWYIVNQLALVPITFPKKGVGKFTSYTSTFTIERLKKYTKIYIAGGVLPITLLMAYLYGLDYVFKRVGIPYEVIESDKTPKDKAYIQISSNKYIVTDLENLNTAFKEDVFRSLLPFRNIAKINIEGELLSKEWFGNVIKHIIESEFILEYIDNIVKVIVDKETYDILLARNEPTNLRDILFYMYEKVVEGFVTDRNDLRYLRNRAYDQIIHVVFDQLKQDLRKYYNYKVNNQTPVLKISPDSIFSKVVTSSSIRLLEYSNPLEEVVNKFKVTYAGYGGIPSDAVPESLRGIHETFYGNIDPVDTPEGATTGVNQTYSIGSYISTTYGAVIPHELTDKIKSGILSLSTASSPFIDKTEPTRGIMVANQSRQAVALENSQPPAVLTGVEFIVPKMASDVFVKKAPCDGKVLDVNDNQITIQCTSGEKHEIQLDSKLARSGQGYHSAIWFKPNVKKGDKVHKDQILTDSNHIKDGILSMGVNLLTTYALLKGYTYEDAIVISESAANKLTSRHMFELFTFLEPTDKLIALNVDIGDYVKAGDLVLQAVSDKLYNLLDFGIINEDEVFIQGNKYTIYAPYDGVVKDIKIYVNTKEVLDPSISEKISKYVNLDENSEFIYKGRRFEGVFIYIYIESTLAAIRGDKLTNRHAAKGVISIVLPDNQMPILPDGRHVELIVNPLSVSGRINMGQKFEMYTGEMSYKLAQIALNQSKQQLIKALENSLLIIDKSNYTKSLIDSLKRDDKYYNELIRYIKKYGLFPVLIPPFKTPTYKEMYKALSNLKIPPKYELTLPLVNNAKIKAQAGYMYWYKLEHMSSAKIHARSIGPYQSKTGQATAGKKAEGGQRLGELDFWAIAAYDAVNILEELFSAGSDDFQVKRQIYRQILREGDASIAQLQEGEQKSKQYLDVLFKAIMLEY